MNQQNNKEHDEYDDEKEKYDKREPSIITVIVVTCHLMITSITLELIIAIIVLAIVSYLDLPIPTPSSITDTTLWIIVCIKKYWFFMIIISFYICTKYTNHNSMKKLKNGFYGIQVVAIFLISLYVILKLFLIF